MKSKRLLSVLICLVSGYSSFYFSVEPFIQDPCVHYGSGKTYWSMSVIFMWAEEMLTRSEDMFEAEKRIRDLTMAPPSRANNLLFNFLQHYHSQDFMPEEYWQELKKYSDGSLFLDEWGRPLQFSFVWVSDEKTASIDLVGKAQSWGENEIDEKGKGDDIVMTMDHLLASRRHDRRGNGYHLSPSELFARRHHRALWIFGLVTSYAFCISSFTLVIKLTRQIKNAKKSSDKKVKAGQ